LYILQKIKCADSVVDEKLSIGEECGVRVPRWQVDLKNKKPHHQHLADLSGLYSYPVTPVVQHSASPRKGI
jgi:hypothetical protein